MRKWLPQLWGTLVDRYAGWIAISGAVIVPVGQCFFKPSPILQLKNFGLFSGLLLLIVGGAATMAAAERKRTLESKYRTLKDQYDVLVEIYPDVYDIWRTQLSYVAARLELAATDRISVYKHTGGHEFLMLGRFAQTASYDQRGRGIYPEDQGVIGQAWDKGEKLYGKAPDPMKSLDDYAAALNHRCNIPEDVARKLNMKSRWIYGLRIDSPSTQKGIAIVVVESTKANRFTLGGMHSVFDEEHQSFLARLVEKLRDREPDPTFAQKEGF